MQIDIQARDFSLTDTLRSHAEQRLRFALTCYGDRIRHVAMQLSDIFGPRGGADKRCHLRVALANLPDVVVEDSEADPYLVIDRAADRAARTVGRRLARQRDIARSSGLCDTVSVPNDPLLPN